jgi:hypothetical protein
VPGRPHPAGHRTPVHVRPGEKMCPLDMASSTGQDPPLGAPAPGQSQKAMGPPDGNKEVIRDHDLVSASYRKIWGRSLSDRVRALALSRHFRAFPLLGVSRLCRTIHVQNLVACATDVERARFTKRVSVHTPLRRPGRASRATRRAGRNRLEKQRSKHPAAADKRSIRIANMVVQA